MRGGIRAQVSRDGGRAVTSSKEPPTTNRSSKGSYSHNQFVFIFHCLLLLLCCQKHPTSRWKINVPVASIVASSSPVQEGKVCKTPIATKISMYFNHSTGSSLNVTFHVHEPESMIGRRDARSEPSYHTARASREIFAQRPKLWTHRRKFCREVTVGKPIM